MPQLPLGSDDEFVVKVAWEAPEEAQSTRKPVLRVFDCATAVLRKELKALRLKMDHNRGLVQQYGRRFRSYCGLGGIPNFELLIFGFIEILNFNFFFSGLEFLRRALIAPDAATAGGSSPRLCVDRACPGLILPFHRGGYCAGIHISHVVWVFGKLHAQLEV